MHLEQIEDNVALYKAGRDSAYQSVALQLRTILLGGHRGLLARVLPDATFHPVRGKYDEEIEEGSAPDDPQLKPVILFGHAEFRGPSRGERTSLTVPIDDLREPLPTGEWLTQWIVRPDISIHALIARTANEEVAHIDEKRGKLLAKLAGTGAMVISNEDLEAGRLDEAHVLADANDCHLVRFLRHVGFI